jgi:hypothetical protein
MTMAGWSSVRIQGLLLTAILLFALSPLIAVLCSATVADWAGCRVDEGGIYPCVIGGKDYGDSLAFLFVLGWLSFITIPLGVAAVCIWFIVLVIRLLVRLNSDGDRGKAAP